MDLRLFLNFRIQLLLSLMLVVVVVTGTTIYLTEHNAQGRYQEALDAKFQEQMRLFSALQDARRRAILDKCRALSHAVRLQAALEENDVEDLYRNALTELQGVYNPGISTSDGPETQGTKALFFRFVDAEGTILSPGEFRAGQLPEGSLDAALVPIAKALRNLENQTVGYIAVSQEGGLTALREVVLTRILDWDGRRLGGLILGFGVREAISADASHDGASASGIWLSDDLYINTGLSDAERAQLAGQISQAVSRESSGHFPVTKDDQPYLLFYKSLDPNTELAPAYEICLYPLAASIQQQRILRWKILGLGGLILLGGLLGSLFLARRLSQPVDKIVAGSVENLHRRRRAEMDLVHANQELAKALSELKATQQQVIQQERLRALGEMASGIAHDFNNTLTPILGFTDLLLERPEILADGEEAARFLKLLRTSAQDAANIVRRLREFYRPLDTQEELVPVELAPVISQVVELTQPKWRQQAQANGCNIEVKTRLQPTPPVAGDESALREALTNLIFNAVDAMPNGGVITLETAVENDQAVVRVHDTGSGMTEEVRQRCLEPFFSTKDDKGTGLGLAMVYGIVQRHRGLLEVNSVLGRGTTFVIRLPLIVVAENEAPAPSVEPAPKSPLQVLVVDDEPGIREVISAFLRSDGHNVITASNGRDGLKEFQSQPFDVVVTDRAMPQMNGDQMAGLIKQARPDIPIVLITGFGNLIEPTKKQATSVDVVLNKPVTLKTLLSTIDNLRHAA
jgi:signal transduction histidine kinase